MNTWNCVRIYIFFLRNSDLISKLCQVAVNPSNFIHKFVLSILMIIHQIVLIEIDQHSNSFKPCQINSWNRQFQISKKSANFMSYFCKLTWQNKSQFSPAFLKVFFQQPYFEQNKRISFQSHSNNHLHKAKIHVCVQEAILCQGAWLHNNSIKTTTQLRGHKNLILIWSTIAHRPIGWTEAVRGCRHVAVMTSGRPQIRGRRRDLRPLDRGPGTWSTAGGPDWVSSESTGTGTTRRLRERDRDLSRISKQQMMSWPQTNISLEPIRSLMEVIGGKWKI